MFEYVTRWSASFFVTLCFAAYIWALLAALLVASRTPALAQQIDPKEAVANAARDVAVKAGTRSPAEIKLRDEATLKLSAGHFFVPSMECLRLMRAYGNCPNANTFIGLVVRTRNDDTWLIAINFIKDDYIADGEAKDLNANELLSDLREGIEEVNKKRSVAGFPQLKITGWVEKPPYDAVTHRLVWSLGISEKGASPQGTPGVNYNTFALGRDAYFSLNLVTNLANVKARKPIVHGALVTLSYVEGKRYQDCNESTDRVAESGLAALISVAAKCCCRQEAWHFRHRYDIHSDICKGYSSRGFWRGAAIKLPGRKKADTPPLTA